MPELPEIEIVKRSLFQKVNKAKIIDVKINNKNLRYKIPSDFSEQLIGEKIISISRRSKYLIFHLKKKLLLVHLGMSGKLLLMKKQDKSILRTSFYYDLNIIEKHNHIYFILNNGYVLVYNDIRRFGFFKLYNYIQLNKIPFISKLGIEPFSKKFNVKYFRNITQEKKKKIKNLLMDQTFLSGLGNIYVNEVLFMTKVKPFRRCNSLDKNEVENLIINIKKILKHSISQGGSSIKDFQSTHGKSGNFQQFFLVYGRENKNCSRISCNGKIKKVIITNRSSFYCSKCQI